MIQTTEEKKESDQFKRILNKYMKDYNYNIEIRNTVNRDGTGGYVRWD